MADQYDPRNVAVIVNGQQIVGFADGTFIEAEKDEDTWSKDVGAQGDVTFVRSADPTGTITLTLKHNSPSNAYLTELARSEETVSILIQDKNFDGDVSAGGSEAKVQKPASFSRGDEVEDMEWVFLVADYEQAFDI